MTLEEKKRKYLRLCHAMQTGVALKMEKEASDTTPKHLRVGVNVAMVEHGALAGLLIKKGVITDDEYLDALIEKMTEEVKSYEAWAHEKFGRPITLK